MEKVVRDSIYINTRIYSSTMLDITFLYNTSMAHVYSWIGINAYRTVYLNHATTMVTCDTNVGGIGDWIGHWSYGAFFAKNSLRAFGIPFMNYYIRPLYLTLVGTCQLAVPVVVVAALYPAWMASFLGMITAAIVLAAYVTYLNYYNTTTQTRGLIFEPTGIYYNDFVAAITACGLNPAHIKVRYCYAQEGIALAFHDTVGIDPLVWKGVENDESFKKAHDVLSVHILPTLTMEQKERIAATRALLTHATQKFIFNHELGHIYHRYTYKKIALNAVIVMIVTYSVLLAGWTLFNVYHVPAILTIALSILLASFIDLTLTFISNTLFKVREEVKADDFASQYSTAEEIRAAADFFEQHDVQIIDLIREPGWNPLQWLPQETRSGHLNGAKRARYLRKLANMR